MVSEDTKKQLPEIIFRELDRVRVKGKDIPVSIYEPLGPAETITSSRREELQQFAQAIGHYRAREWDMAESCLRRLQQVSPQDALYALYLQRIARFRANPPETDWDGTFAFLRK